MPSRIDRTLNIDLERCPQELRAGIAEIQHERPERFGKATRATAVTFQPDEGARELAVSADGNAVTVQYPNLAHAFRALGRLLGDAPLTNYRETCRFEMLG